MNKALKLLLALAILSTVKVVNCQDEDDENVVVEEEEDLTFAS